MPLVIEDESDSSSRALASSSAFEVRSAVDFCVNQPDTSQTWTRQMTDRPIPRAHKPESRLKINYTTQNDQSVPGGGSRLRHCNT